MKSLELCWENTKWLIILRRPLIWCFEINCHSNKVSSSTPCPSSFANPFMHRHWRFRKSGVQYAIFFCIIWICLFVWHVSFKLQFWWVITYLQENIKRRRMSFIAAFGITWFLILWLTTHSSKLCYKQVSMVISLNLVKELMAKQKLGWHLLAPAGKLHEAASIYERMLSLGVIPSLKTYSIMIR